MNGQDTTAPATVVEHLRRVLGDALRAVLLFGLGFALAGALAAEALGAYVARGWPLWPAHVAAVAMGVTLGYAAAVTVALRAVLVGVVKSVEWTLAEVEGVADRVVHEVETLTHATEPARGEHHSALPARRGAPSWGADGMAGGVLAGVEHDEGGRVAP
jgi:hypothetical protein